MKTVVATEFTPEDVELLKKVIPDNPCHSCYSYGKGECLGCPAQRKYDANVKPYEDANILQYAEMIRERRDINAQIDSLKLRVKEITEQLPEFAKEYGLPAKGLGGMFKAAEG